MKLASSAQAQRRTIGERALTARRRLSPKVGQRELAAQLGWGPNRVGQVERAVVALDITELYDLASALDVTPEWLMGLTDVTVG